MLYIVKKKKTQKRSTMSCIGCMWETIIYISLKRSMLLYGTAKYEYFGGLR